MPKFSAAELSAAEASMEDAYSKTQSGRILRWGTVTPEGIKRTQQAWISYRDAWVAFGKKYPRVSRDSWKTWLAQERTGMLSKFAY